VLQGVLTGIAFLGAGAIIRSDKAGEHPGLTTAANVFVVASIGIACGLGEWWAAFFGFAFAFLILVALSPIEQRLERLANKQHPDDPNKPSNDA
jgi:putative Mg2+ transporter-C (MgtC) family protein